MPRSKEGQEHRRTLRFWVPYQKRNARLRSLGLANSYEEYLASDLWRSIRARVLDRDDHLCQICGDQANTAHHSTYTAAALTGRSINGIFAVCGDCHKFIEFSRDGEKLHITLVRKRCYLLARLKGRQFVLPEHKGKDSDTRRRCGRCGRRRSLTQFNEKTTACLTCQRHPHWLEKQRERRRRKRRS